jgi:hypothetical protein
MASAFEAESFHEAQACKRKYGRIPYDQFHEPIRKDRCVQCRDFCLQLDKEFGFAVKAVFV